MMTVRERLQAVLEASRPELIPFIPAVIRPAIQLEVSNVLTKDLPIGASKLGGVPDLAEHNWPTLHNQPMLFIGQIKLQDVHPHDEDDLLPSQGLLSFFLSQSAVNGDTSNPNCCAVLYESDVSKLRRAVPATEYFEHEWTVPLQAITFCATYHPYGIAFQQTPDGKQYVCLEEVIGDSRWLEEVIKPLADVALRPPFLLGCTVVAGQQFNERIDEMPIFTIGGIVGQGIFPFLNGNSIYAFSFLVKSETLQHGDLSQVRLVYDAS